MTGAHLAGVTVFPVSCPHHPPTPGLWWAVRFEGQAFRHPATGKLMKFPTPEDARTFGAANIVGMIEGRQINSDTLAEAVRILLGHKAPNKPFNHARTNVIDLRPEGEKSGHSGIDETSD